MILSIGWKNVWRNKTRSLVVIVAVMLGIFGGIMAAGIMHGWIEQRIHAGIYKESAHVQIHNPEYLYNEEMKYTVTDYEQVINILDTIPDLVAYSPRVKLFVLAKTSWATSGFLLRGVDPVKEKQVSEVYHDLVEGDFLEGSHRKPPIVIGSEAAENLKLLNYQVTAEKLNSIDTETIPETVLKKIRTIRSTRFRTEKKFRAELDKVLSKEESKEYSDQLLNYFSFYRMRASIEITMQDKNDEIIHPVFKLGGIYETDNSMFDGLNAFVDRSVLNQYTGLSESEVHEIAILSTDNETGVALADKLTRYLPGQDVMSWRKAVPEIAMYTDFSNLISYIYVVIILFALAFGIINTMMMSVLERFKELGMLMAVGMNKRRVFTMIMTESVFLTLTGAVVGMAFSGIILAILGQTGINFGMWAEGFEAIGYAAIVYPSVTWQNYVVITLLVIITGIVSSIWPARKALKLNPVDALRTE